MVFRYDLQNTIALPTSTVSIAFYLRKLNLFNLTGYCSSNGKTYCSFWDESRSGRGGNDLASAHNLIIQKAIDENPEVSEIIVWSDNCVPQNKNQMVALSSLTLLKNNPQIKQIVHKYGEAGHSYVQQIDSVHSSIEKHCRGMEFFSPVSWFEHMRKFDYPKVKLDLHEMISSDFKNYSVISNQFAFHNVPFKSVRMMIYNSQDLLSVGFKTEYDDDFTKVTIIKGINSRLTKRNQLSNLLAIPDIPLTTKRTKVSDEKKKDLKKMLKFMNDTDKDYYVRNIFN